MSRDYRLKQIKKDINELCISIGPRPTGSSANREAVSYLAGRLEKIGLNFERQDFECIDWEGNDARLIVGGSALPMQPAGYSLSCDFSSTISVLNSLEELEKSDVSGKIVIMAGELSSEELMPKNFPFYNPDHHQEIIAGLENKQPAAIVTAGFSGEYPKPIIEDGDFDIPCAYLEDPKISPDELAGKEGRLFIDAARRPATGSNLVATAGPKTTAKILVCAHLDTARDTPGALDNATGVSALLALGELLDSLNLAAGIELVFFNGEDYFSSVGQVTFLKSRDISPDSYRLAVNCDGLGMKNSRIAISGYETTKECEELINRFCAANSNLQPVDPWPQGDHMIFAMKGITALALTSADIFKVLGSITHTDQDHPGQVDYEKVLAAVRFLSEFIPEFIKLPEIPPN